MPTTQKPKLNHGMFSSRTDDWATPQHVFNNLDSMFNFTVDVCASKKNAKCKKYYTKDSDGLKQEWGGMLDESSIWKRHRAVDKKGERVIGSNRRLPDSSKVRHKMVSRLCDEGHGNMVYKRTLEIRREQAIGAVSFDDSYFQPQKEQTARRASDN